MAARSQIDYIKRALDRQSVFRTAVLYRTVLETMLDISLTTFLLALTSVLYYDNMRPEHKIVRSGSPFIFALRGKYKKIGALLWQQSVIPTSSRESIWILS